MSHEWRDHSDVTANESYFWTNGFRSCFPCYCKYPFLKEWLSNIVYYSEALWQVNIVKELLFQFLCIYNALCDSMCLCNFKKQKHVVVITLKLLIMTKNVIWDKLCTSLKAYLEHSGPFEFLTRKKKQPWSKSLN